MRLAVVLAFGFALILVATTGDARIWYILPDGSGDAPTIQAGLDSAVAGDTVLVSAGEYRETLSWPPRNGIVLSGSGMESTLVVGDQVDTLLAMHGAFIDSSTVVRSLRFRNGGVAGLVFDAASAVVESCAIDSTRTGPAVYCLRGSAAKIANSAIENNQRGGVKISDCDSRLTVTGNVFHENWFGPGIYCLSSSPILSANTIGRNIFEPAIKCIASAPLILANTIRNSHGGITCASASSPMIRDNAISHNTEDYGSGIACLSSNPEIIENRITENTGFRGGGIGCFDSSPRIIGNWIEGNIAELDYGSEGGGICCDNSSPLISGNVIVGNSAGFGAGGGIACSESSPTISGNVIAENEAPSMSGAGIVIWSPSSPTVSGNSIIRNRAREHGGAVFCTSSGPVFTANTITENFSRLLGDAFRLYGAPTIASCNIAYNGRAIDTAAGIVPSAVNNWWGDPSGPWHETKNPGGLGDSLSYWASDFVPWLVCPDTTAPPIPPRNLSAEPQPDGSLLLAWNPVPLQDLGGYRVHFDTAAVGYAYGDSIGVGNVTTYVLGGLQDETKYYVAVTCYDLGGNLSWYSAPDSAVAQISTGVEATPGPTAYRLWPNAPNPFNAATTIRFWIPVEEPVAVTIHDVAARRLATIAQGVYRPGEFTVVWNGKDSEGAPAPSGIYFARLRAGDFTATRKMILLR